MSFSYPYRRQFLISFVWEQVSSEAKQKSESFFSLVDGTKLTWSITIKTPATFILWQTV